MIGLFFRTSVCGFCRSSNRPVVGGNKRANKPLKFFILVNQAISAVGLF